MGVTPHPAPLPHIPATLAFLALSLILVAINAFFVAAEFAIVE